MLGRACVRMSGPYIELRRGWVMVERDIERAAVAANRIASWLCKRDIRELTREALREKQGLSDGQADWFVLFGGGVVGLADALSDAMRAGVARRYAIVGGRGRATYWLDEAMERELIEWDDALCARPVPGETSEAEMLAALLLQRHGLVPDLLETHSTNCGNNITNLLDLLDREAAPASIILSQDAAMQRRMGATWARQVWDRPRYRDAQVIEWAFYQAELGCVGGRLDYVRSPRGIWKLDMYCNLLLGDVERLTDDESGYGPRGRDFLVHVDVPLEVREAHDYLAGQMGSLFATH